MIEVWQMKRVMEKKERKEIYDDEVRVFIY